MLSLAGAVALAGEREREPRWLGLTYLGGSVELRYESEEEERTSKGTGARTRVEDELFREIAELNWRGFVYHPRLLDLKGTLGLTLEQGDISVASGSDERSAARRATRPLYAVSGVFLARHPVSLSFGLTRQHGTISPGFGERADLETSSEQARLHFRNAWLPTEVFYSRSRSIYSQRGIGEDRDEQETSYGFVMRHQTAQSDSELSYEHSDSTDVVTDPSGDIFEDVFGDVTVLPVLFVAERRRHDLSFTNRLRLGSSQQHWLSSVARYYDEAGTLPSRRLSIDESLHLAHTDHLSSDYGLSYMSYTFGDSTTDVASGRAGLSHELYESLLTRVDVHGSQERFDGSSRNVLGSSVSWRYRKTIPHGTAFLNLGLGYDTTDESGGSTIRPVVDEAHVLDDAATVLLDHIDVIEGTIAVTNAAGTVLYFRDFDYRVILRGRRIELRRVITGRINNGDTVLVDYSYEVGAPINYATLRYHWRAQADLFNHVSLYAGVNTTKNRLRSGIDEGRLQDLVNTLCGARLTWGPATLTLEHQDYDSTQAPYVSDTVLFDIRHQWRRVHSIGLSASHRHTTYEGNEESTSRAVSASYALTPAAGPSFGVTAGYDQSDDRDFRSSHTFARVEARYRIRATEIAATFWLRDRDDDFATHNRSYFLLTIRREF